MTDWLWPTLALLPVLLGVWWAVGVPWALVLLPRADWRDRVLVLTLGLAQGVMLHSAGMFLLGTFAMITLGGSLAVSGAVALSGAALAWRRAAEPAPARAASAGGRLAAWEWLILAGVGVALVLRVVRVAYWPFAAYDALWVYGYNARVFTLTGQIPASMGYYPQLLPLSFTFGQLVWGGINDHAARAAIPLIGAGSLAAAYLLGRRLFDRRVGMLTLALWAFFPPHADWSRFGDLEVPLTFYFTLAALCFLLAWRADPADRTRWRYAALAGLMLGGGMWTKPTAGALVWGIGLVFLAAVVRGWGDWPRVWDRFRLVVWVGLWSAPIGGMWYIRNLALGHPAVVFPPSYWLTLAQRSGRQLALPLLMLALLAIWLVTGLRRADRRLILPGLLIMVVSALPSAGLGNLPTHRLTALEVGGLVAGLALYGAGVWRWWRAGGRFDRDRVALVGGVWALILPYWFTWFWSYSYHPRLAFAITPLQLLIVALLVVAVAERLPHTLGPVARRRLAHGALLALIVPGLGFTFHDTAGFLLSGELRTDDDKQHRSNYALFQVVRTLREEVAAADRPIKIVAPGNLRLPFFFPDLPVITDPVTDLRALDAGVTHYIDGFEADVAYRENGTPVNQARGAMGLPRLAEHLLHVYDADFYYNVYRVDTARRFTPPEFNGVLDPVPVYEGLAEVPGYSITGLELWPGRRLVLNLYFHVLGETDVNYTIYVHVMDGDRLVHTWDHMPGQDKYLTSLWEPGEYIEDQLWVDLPADIPPGEYQVRMGLYNLQTGERLPVRVGDEVTDGFLLIPTIRQLPAAPE